MEKTIAQTIKQFSGHPGEFKFEEGLYTFIARIWEKKGLFFRRHFGFAFLFIIDDEQKEVTYEKVLWGKAERSGQSFCRRHWSYSNKTWRSEAPWGSLGKRRFISTKKDGFTYRRLQIVEAVQRAAEAKGYSLKHPLWGKM